VVAQPLGPEAVDRRQTGIAAAAELVGQQLEREVPRLAGESSSVEPFCRRALGLGG